MLLDARPKAVVAWPPFFEIEPESAGSTRRVMLRLSAESQGPSPGAGAAASAQASHDASDSALPTPHQAPPPMLLVVCGSDAILAQDVNYLVPGTLQTIR